ncbi:MAG: hypothetical protein NUV96_02920 [Candidatus Colwellbacteria bacterium]|nr:hypothetical protein [Candidatus Colwellbacteria bacterium]
MQNRILIVGAGEIGSALSGVLKKNKNNRISIWDIDPKRCYPKMPLEQMVSHTDFLFLCIPSHAIDACIDKVKKHIGKKTFIISLTKGIERKKGFLTSELLVKNFGKERIAILAGPMLAEELRRGFGAKACLATSNNAFKKISPLFSGSILSVEQLGDIHGASASGVLKNIYSLGLGIAAGLKMGANARGILLLQATKEMQILMLQFKGKPTTVLTLAGLGDLEATSSSEYSKNHATGLMIANGKKITHYCEGDLSLPLVVKRLGKKKLLPFMGAISQVAHGKKNPRKIFEGLLK